MAPVAEPAPVPLIVCGMGRSGTRNAANALNAHREVKLFGELPIGIARALFSLLQTADDSHARNETYEQMWRAKKAAFMFDAFDAFDALGTLGPSQPVAAGVRFVGHKTPRHEVFFDDYERYFAAVGLEPRYVYCARDALSCWRSYTSMAWNVKSLSVFLDQYAESFESLNRMLEHAGPRVAVARLGDLQAAPHLIDWYRETLFEPLGLELDDDTANLISAMPNRNATSRVTGKPPVELDEEEVLLIDQDERVATIRREHFA